MGEGVLGILKIIREEFAQILDNFRFEREYSSAQKAAKQRHARQLSVNQDGKISQPPMSGTEYRWRQSWNCVDCHRYNEIFYDKYAASISSERPLNQAACAYCDGMEKVDSAFNGSWDIDEDILTYWLMRDEDVCFCTQNEYLWIEGLSPVFLCRVLDRVLDAETPVDPYKLDMLTDWVCGNFLRGDAGFMLDPLTDKDLKKVALWLREHETLWRASLYEPVHLKEVARKVNKVLQEESGGPANAAV